MFESCLDFASRQNAKRGYLHVSKVLGKHIPCKPSTMRFTYNCLAERIGVDPSVTYVVGMSETATGLGGGVADSLATLPDSGDVIYQHTTRARFDQPVWFGVTEAHSHATSHLLYEPHESLIEDVKSARRLVLVDDEISTGKTLSGLARSLLQKLPHVEEVIFVTLVSWVDASIFAASVEDLPSFRVVSLISGTFDFEPDAAFQVDLPGDVEQEPQVSDLELGFGRQGIRVPKYGFDVAVPLSFVAFDPCPLNVIGTGEFLLQPFLFAEKLEEMGFEVMFQSTTRSPIVMGDCIETKVSFSPGNGGAQEYLYNFHGNGVTSVVCYENESALSRCNLIDALPSSDFMLEVFS